MGEPLFAGTALITADEGAPVLVLLAEGALLNKGGGATEGR